MKETHPNDRELQAWLEHDSPQRDRLRIESHLKQCLFCRRRAESFRVLFSVLSTNPGYELPLETRKQILGRAQVSFSRRQRLVLGARLAFYGVGLALFAAVSAYFVDPIAVFERIRLSLIDTRWIDERVLTSVHTLFLNLNLDWRLLAFALVALAVIALIDQLFSSLGRRFFLC
ncbi:hypothetical protein JW992_09655 [candidate division KSB1 bacterium]|nr:hypothetical protein [candidate division KSB1 bacterium]